MTAAYRWRHTGAQLWMWLHMGGLLLILRLVLPWIKLPKLLAWLTPAACSRRATPQSLEHAVWCATILLRLVFPWRRKCLPRTLTLYYFATRSGYPVRVHCGIQRHGDNLQGHAWLSLYGCPFLENDDPMPHYVIVWTFPQAEPSEEIPGLPHLTSHCDDSPPGSHP